MRTTINDQVDRRGGAYEEQELEEILFKTRKILADTSAFLELKIDQLFETEFDKDDKEHANAVKSLIQQLQAAWRQVLDMQAKTGCTGQGAAINLEAARAEIESRLARLAA